MSPMKVQAPMKAQHPQVSPKKGGRLAVGASSHVRLSLPVKKGPLKEGSCTVSPLKKRSTQRPTRSPLLQAPARMQLVQSEICPGSGRLRPEQTAVCLIHVMLLHCARAARAPRAQRRAPVPTKCALPKSASSKPSWLVQFRIEASSRLPSEGNEGSASIEPKSDTNCKALPGASYSGASCSLMCRQEDAETCSEPRIASRLQSDGILAEAVQDLGSFALQAVHSCEP
ncbi:unnamed protein product [Symbiodinium sp. CCMP2456]|nr:unnamed protein product [Symbiodinium sp. CCMP2456]